MAVGLYAQAVIEVDREIAQQLGQDLEETTVLVRAVRAGAVRETRFLLERGCDPNLPYGVHRIRPLMFACHLSNIRRRSRVLKLLLRHGANPTLKDIYRRNSLMHACALSVEDSLCMMLLDHDYDLSDIDQDGNTLLHICAMAGNLSILRHVLQDAVKYNIEMSLRNDFSLTPLSVAVLRNNWSCADTLHAAGATPRLPVKSDSGILQSLNNPSVLSTILLAVFTDMKANACCARASESIFVSTQSMPFLRESVSNFQSCSTKRLVQSASRLLPRRTCNTVSCVRPKTATYQCTTVEGSEAVNRATATSIRAPYTPHSILSHPVLSRLYSVQKSSLYYKPQPMAKIDQSWIEAIKKYSEPPPTDDSSDSEVGNVKPPHPLGLTRAVSSPFEPVKHITTARPRAKLTRYTTSPQFDLSTNSIPSK